MKTTVFVFHPNLTESKINSKMVEELLKNNIEVRNMYELYPDFKFDVEKEHKVMEETDRIVLQFPIYWYSSPALLKEWEDVILTHSWAYGSKGNVLHGKELVLAVTAGGDLDEYQHDGSVRYRLTELLRPFQATSDLIGTKFMEPFEVYSTETLVDEQRVEYSEKYVEYITRKNLEVLGERE